MALQPYMSMITLGVDNIPAAIKFYEEGLGFPRMEPLPTVAFFMLKGAWLGLFGRKELAEDANAPFEPAGFNSLAIAHNVGSRRC
jgi:catechol 2,3-dioxygenase-like lactoylglutathione lyase family enzyme